MHAFSRKRLGNLYQVDIEVKFPCSPFQTTFIFVALAYFSNCIFVNPLISVVVSFAVLTLYQDNLDDYLVYLYLSSFSVVYFFSSNLQLSKVIYIVYSYLPYYIYSLLNLFYVEFDKSIISRYSCNYTL